MGSTEPSAYQLSTHDQRLWLQICLFASIWLLIPLLYRDLEWRNFLRPRDLGIFVLCSMLVLINIKVLIPRLYINDKVWRYLFIALILIITCVLLMEYVIDPPRLMSERSRERYARKPHLRVTRTIYSTIPFILAIIGSALFEITNYANRKVKETLQLHNEKLATEMKLLKSQINPHFLFNALNNIYSLSYLKPQQTPDNLLKLSDLLRYILYECNAEKVPVQREVEYLQNFIDLQQLKDSRGMNITTHFDPIPEDIYIAPMLLIPFVENAFKHSHVEDISAGWIDISLRIHDNRITFTVANSNPRKHYTKDQIGGIGLTNVRRQLELQYPDQHQLSIEHQKDQYRIVLQINMI